MSAVIHGYTRTANILLRAGADLHERNKKEGTCLEIASKKGFHPIARSLLLHGANVNADGIFYRNALHAASAHDKAEIVELLLQHGASVNGNQVLLHDTIEETAIFEPFDISGVVDMGNTFLSLNDHMPLSHRRNQSAIPNVDVGPPAAPGAGDATPKLSKKPHIYQSSEQHSQKFNINNGLARENPTNNALRTPQDEEVLGARLLESLKVAPSRAPDRFTSELEITSLNIPVDVSPKTTNTDHLISDDGSALPANESQANSSNLPLPPLSPPPASGPSVPQTLPSISNLINKLDNVRGGPSIRTLPNRPTASPNSSADREYTDSHNPRFVHSSLPRLASPETAISTGDSPPREETQKSDTPFSVVQPLSNESFACTHPDCTAEPFRTQYLLK
ncbi:MAG: hypothetical protein Q9218_003897 [Villophora microphyllina]